MAHEALLADLDRRRAEAARMGGEDKLAKRRERGQLNAEERLAALVDKDSFLEVGLLGASAIDAEAANTPRDGKLTGFGRIDGRDVGVVVNDFTTKGASTSATNSKKLGYIRKTCTEKGMPFVHVGESTGARLPDAMGSKGMGALLGNDTSQFRRMRETPWVAAALDTSFGSSAWLCCCSDFAVMRKGSIMSVSSPRLVSMAIGEKVDLEDLGGWRLHAEQTGLIDHFVDTDEEAMAAIRTFLSYMPSHNGELAPEAPASEGSGEAQERVLDIMPEKRTQVYNMKKILEVVFDNGSIFELKPRFGKSAVVGARPPRRKGRRHHRQQSAGRRRRALRRGVPEDHRLHRSLRQLQRAARPLHGHAGLRRRNRRGAARRARPHHELHERHVPHHRAAGDGDLPKSLWPRLCRDGRRRA